MKEEGAAGQVANKGMTGKADKIELAGEVSRLRWVRQPTITGNPGEKPPSPSRRTRRGNKAGQLCQGEREPPETDAGYTRQTDLDIPELPVTEEERRQTKASSHLLLREGF
ncbi:hypothetical protein DY000_02024190 [Brassica cretica]|uniref:Uncharacterized protein n=1 Tax=Brassica cretica TaxID=69181 RepID=A0ABQ7ECA6_BRACR|nr:hypothetical protein DY000_02024190 [Brassica cretica]